VLGTLLTGAQQVLALTEQQVMDRLRPVPVFTITDDRGAPLVASPPEGEEGEAVAGVFISEQDAQNFLTTLRQNNPQVAEGVQVVPVSLAEVYQLAQTTQSEQSSLRFSFVPMDQQVQVAVTLLQESGQTEQRFNGVPIFLARSTAENGGYLTIQQGEQQVIPMFFVRDELQAMLDRLKEQQPDLASQMSIQVINLEGLIQTLKDSDNAELSQIMLVPPRETIEFIRANTPAQGQPGQPPQQRTPATP
jgi:Tic22-like family